MSILNIQTAQPTGLASVNPSVIYIETSDTYAVVTATGYLTQQASQGYVFSNDQMALVKTSDEGVVWLKVALTYSGALIENVVVSLVQISSPGDVILPTIANHLIVSTDTAGTLGNLTGTAINNGNIQSGLSTGGIVGSFVAYPTTASKGFLALTALVNATGNFSTTISNALAIGQSQVVSIPDGGTTTSNFIISNSGSTQTIATGSLALSVGTLTLGSSTHASSMTIFPASATNGTLIVSATNAGAANNTTITNGVMGQSTVYTIPDAGNAVGRFLVGASATPFVSGNLPVASGTGGLMADSGTPLVNLQPYSVTVTMNTASVIGAYATPVQILPTPGAGKAIMVLSAQIVTEVSTPFATGGVAIIQYGNSVHGAGTLAIDATTPAAEITAASSQIYTQYGLASTTVTATAAITATGIYFSNQTGAFTDGTGSTVSVVLTYMVIPAV